MKQEVQCMLALGDALRMQSFCNKNGDQALPGLSGLTARLLCRVLLVGVGSAGISHDFEIA